MVDFFLFDDATLENKILQSHTNENLTGDKITVTATDRPQNVSRQEQVLGKSGEVIQLAGFRGNRMNPRSLNL